MPAGLDGVDDALLVNVVGLDANQSVLLRKQLRDKNIQLLVVKNSLARRATEGTSLGPSVRRRRGYFGAHLGRRGSDLVGQGSR